MSLNDLKDALMEVCPKLWRYIAPPKASVPYAVWAEDTRMDFLGDDHHAEHGWQGTLDYFTKTEDDPQVTTIENALDALPIGWTLNSVQHEEETGVIHFEWVWSLYG